MKKLDFTNALTSIVLVPICSKAGIVAVNAVLSGLG